MAQAGESEEGDAKGLLPIPSGQRGTGGESLVAGR